MEPANPTVSVIVPNYNHAPFLTGRIESILRQTFRDFELIILDDHSSDQSKQIISSYQGNPKVSNIIYNDSNSGSPFRQWNKGIAMARGSLIWIAESDDYCEWNFLEKTVAKMKEYPSAGLVYSQSLEMDEITGENLLSFAHSPRFAHAFGQSYFAKGKSELNEKLAYENTIPNASGVLFRKSVYEEVHGTDETMRLCGDWLLWVKMLLVSDVYFLAEPLNYFRLTSASARSKFTRMQTFHERIRVLRLMIENDIPAAGKTQRLLIRNLFNSYKIHELKEPVRKVLAEPEMINHKTAKIIVGILLSFRDRIVRKFTASNKRMAPG